ncbi:MAG: YkgJ family cysteine cluster protein [Candidatus Gastranaerophilales bacterium]|nr:YkgJ family cysteine cluster protein [Candidatus Gastranaerophilales bacterium]
MFTIIKNIKKIIYKYILKRTYYRHGKCACCGICCQRIYVRHKKSVIDTKEEFEKLKHLHPFYTYLNIIDEDDLGLVFECTKFDKENKICTIHDKRPGICRRYPSEQIFTMGAILAPECGYSFSPIEEFDEVFENVMKKASKQNKKTISADNSK